MAQPWASVRDAPNRAGRQVARKTGTSDDNESVWSVGYTPNLVTAVGLWGEAAAEVPPLIWTG